MGHELRMDHARALAERGDADFLRAAGAGNFDVGEGGLLNGVGGENGFGYIEEVIDLCAECGGGFGQRGDKFFGGKRDADDSGGRWEDFFGLAAEGFRGGFAGGDGGVESCLAGGAVGVACIDGGETNAASGGGEIGRASCRERVCLGV